jgi:hypothetical protein
VIAYEYHQLVLTVEAYAEPGPSTPGFRDVLIGQNEFPFSELEE